MNWKQFYMMITGIILKEYSTSALADELETILHDDYRYHFIGIFYHFG